MLSFAPNVVLTVPDHPARSDLMAHFDEGYLEKLYGVRTGTIGLHSPTKEHGATLFSRRERKIDKRREIMNDIIALQLNEKHFPRRYLPNINYTLHLLYLGTLLQFFSEVSPRGSPQITYY